MSLIGMRELRQQTSEVMRRVREEGAEYVVTYRGRPVAIILDDTDRAVALAATLRGWPSQTLVPLDEALSDRAVHLAATMRLRGADAVYAAVAQQYGTTLVTLDWQQLERLPTAVRSFLARVLEQGDR